MKIFFITLGIIGVCMGLHDAWRIRGLLGISKGLQTLKPFERAQNSQRQKILVIGDSTAVGTGADTNERSIAGLLGQFYPEADIKNEGINGQRIHELATGLDPQTDGSFDILIIQIGANDITHFTSLSSVRTDLGLLLKKAHSMSPRVVILHSGRVGNSPLFPWYTRWIFNRRTAQVRDIYRDLSPEYGASYVDLYASSVDQVFASRPDLYYAADKFHPSAAGYAVWFDQIKDILER